MHDVTTYSERLKVFSKEAKPQFRYRGWLGANKCGKSKERAVQKRRKAYARKGLIMARSKTSRKDQKKASLVKRRVKQNMVKDEARGLSIVKEFHFYPRSNGK